MQVDTNQLAPAYRDGDTITMRPAPCVDSATIAPGTLVLAAALHRTKPNVFAHFGLFTMSADHDLTCGSFHVEHGKFIVLGIHAPEFD